MNPFIYIHICGARAWRSSGAVAVCLPRKAAHVGGVVLVNSLGARALRYYEAVAACMPRKAIHMGGVV